jgi:hypothetical protein
MTHDLTRGPIPLRPMNLGDLLDGAVRLFVANWRALLLAVGVVVVPLQLLAAFVQRNRLPVGLFQLFTDPTALERLARQSNAPSPGQQAASFLGLVFFLLFPVLIGAACVIAGQSYLGRPVDWRAALRAAGGRFGSLLGATILVSLVLGFLFLPTFVAFVVAVVTRSGGLAALSVLLLFSGLVAAVMIGSLYVAVVPAVVMENLSPIAAMRRSWRLRRPRLWPTVGALIVTWLFVAVVSIIVGVVTSAIAAGLGGAFAWVLVGIGGLVGQLVQIPFSAIVATLLYYDGRIRQEGLDLQLMAADLGE